MQAVLLFFFSAALLFSPYAPLRASVVINEVLTGAQTGGEWIEIFNSGAAPENLSGWQLYPDSAGYFSFPADFIIGAKKFVVVRLRAAGTDSQSDLYHASALSNMGNTSGSAALFSGTPRSKQTIKSFVQWGREGETWEDAASDAGLWDRGSYAATTSPAAGFSIGLTADGVSAGSAGAWSIFSAPTPGSANARPPAAAGGLAAPAAAGAGSSSVPATAAANSSAGIAAPLPWLRAYAGQDRIVGAGSQTDFTGSAAGIKGEPLEGARFLWNFGDGEIKEGRAASHIFQIPGVYTVGLHVSSHSEAVSDYLRVSVVPNKVTIESVVQGADGFVRMKNEGDDEIDIGEWIMEDAKGKRFALPARTKIAPKSEVAFANAVTGILKTGDSAALALYYPNGIPAIRWSMPSPAPPAPLAERERSSAAQASGYTAAAGVSAGKRAASAPASSVAASASVPRAGPRDRVSSGTAKKADGVSAPISARPKTQGVKLFWITAIASGIAAVGFFLTKMFL